MVYITLFFSALISATLFPLGSEALLIYDVQQGHAITLLLIVATAGNTLGSCINYWLGLKGEDYLEHKGYIKKATLQKYQNFFYKYGGYSLLLSWMPIIGDPLTFIAGVLKYPFKWFFLLVLIAKFVRYALLVYAIV
ncbi:YqaA family protein [Candidatus Marinarcus aquaticus]|uniref:VTT domain-containing protein n=1 Tax=Candidatus Marinarcus aquaticus TaxID=2044504 RepID=A0A4Q0XR50_9BACT|nr:YqaA family protein [Candidatus Marinarcus aquaticus]RXJ58108.1 hypothetical protein CRV04_06265 [Candidatus Marinarcus aquaticus]